MLKLIYSICCFLVVVSMYDSQAQCNQERHSTNWFDGWTSCEMAISPNPDRPNSHWIMYDLKKEHRLDRTHVWNYNDMNNLDYGIREVAIDYSLDGSTWTNAGTYSLDQADGSSLYEGNSGPNLGGIRARYVLLTSLTNYGGTCHALSEIRIEAQEINVSINETEGEEVCLSVDIFPNPVRSNARVYVESDCKGEIQYQLIDMTGKVLRQNDITSDVSQLGYFNLTFNNFSSGEYILHVENQEGSIKKTLIKI